MRHLFHFEQRNEALASPTTFSARLSRNARWAFGVIVASMAVGMAGYMGFEHMGVVDAFANAAMILSGMGPLTPLLTVGGKIFAGLYAIASGLLLFAIAGLILAPVYHRILHRFHVEDQDEPETTQTFHLLPPVAGEGGAKHRMRVAAQADHGGGRA